MYSSYRDARAVDETLAMVRAGGHSLFPYNSLVPGFETGDIAYQMWYDGVDPAQLIESVKDKWDTLIAQSPAGH
jgi:hypothetical protein